MSWSTMRPSSAHPRNGRPQQRVGVGHRGGAHYPVESAMASTFLGNSPAATPLQGQLQHPLVGVVDHEPGAEHRQAGVVERNLVRLQAQRPLPATEH